MKALVGLGLASVGVGLILLIGGVRRFRRTHVTARWRRAEARIASAEIVESSGPLSPGVGIWYVPRVTYQYSVAGRSFTAILEDPGVESSRAAADLHEIWDLYPIGQALLIRYDPIRPEHSVPLGWAVSTGVPSIVMGAALLVIGIACEVGYLS